MDHAAFGYQRQNFWYYTYTGWSWLLGLWVAGLLILDVWLYFFGGTKLLRGLKWYWAFCSVPAALAVLYLLGLPLNSLIIIICAFFAPLYQPIALSWLLFEKIAGMGWSVCIGVGGWSAGLLFCLSPNLTSCSWYVHQLL